MLLQLFNFYLALLLVFILPGFSVIRLFFRQQSLSLLEKVFLTPVISLAVADLILLLLNYFGLPLQQKTVGLAFFSFVLLIEIINWRVIQRILPTNSLSFFFSFYRRFSNRKNFRSLLSSVLRINKNKNTVKPINSKQFNQPIKTIETKSLILTSRQTLVFIILFIALIVFRLSYLINNSVPKSTDLGHHMYWVNNIIQTHRLPTYSEKFIIGEHLPFAALALISKFSVVSVFPLAILFGINLLTILGFFLLAYYLAADLFSDYLPASWRFSAADLALWALLAGGLLYPFTAPQAKFVSGGVVGNIIGNLLIIAFLYALQQAFRKSSARWAGLSSLFLLTLIYTHHLSTFILLYILLAFTGIFLFLTGLVYRHRPRELWRELLPRLKAFGQSAWFLVIALVFIFWIRRPSYLTPQAIDTAVGTPTKVTRLGISLTGLIQRLGAWRVLSAGLLAGYWLSLVIYFRRHYLSLKKLFPSLQQIFSFSLLSGWLLIIFLMSWQPGWLKVDIPSQRIVTYLSYPLSLAAGFGAFLFLRLVSQRLPRPLFTLVFSFLLILAFLSGIVQETALHWRPQTKNNRETMETYLAAEYLIPRTTSQEQILKDHVHLAGDAWLKIFFNRGYKYPLSHTYEHRYNDPYNKHETCTRDMFSQPLSASGQQCFQETGVKYILLKKGYGDQVFLSSPQFQKVYSSANVVIFKKY